MRGQEGPFNPTHGVKHSPAWGKNSHVIDTYTSAKIRYIYIYCFLIMSKLILVQNNHFSKVCTIFCLFKKIIIIIIILMFVR